MSGDAAAMVRFPEVRTNCLFPQLAALPTGEAVKSFKVFPSEAQFLAGSIALGWDWILSPALVGGKTSMYK